MATAHSASPSAPQTNGTSPHDPPPYGGQQAQPQPTVEYAIFVYRPGAGYRFVSAFLVATLIWVLFGMLVQSSLYVLHPQKWNGPGVLIPIGGEYTIPPGIHLDQCIQGQAWKSSSVSNNISDVGHDDWVWGATTYDLPVSSESLLVVSRGQNLVGSVEMETSPYQPRDRAMVRVLMSSSSNDILEGTKACLVRRGDNELGVGVFTPTTWKPGNPPGTTGSHYRIVVVLPEVEHPSTLLIKNFETDVPGNAHVIQDLARKVLFDRISLSGSNGFVTVQSLRANVMNISTSGSPISGNFHAAKELSLSTSHANILVNVNLTNLEGWNSTFSINAHGGNIRAKINLFSAALSANSFSVNANNSGGGVRLVFPESSPLLDFSELHVRAITSRGLGSVTLPPTYEGSFDLRTDHGEPVVNINTDVEDPFGLGRKRRVNYENVGKGVVAGYVDWAKSGRPRGKGTVSLTSSGLHYLTGVQLYG